MTHRVLITCNAEMDKISRQILQFLIFNIKHEIFFMRMVLLLCTLMAIKRKVDGNRGSYDKI